MAPLLMRFRGGPADGAESVWRKGSPPRNISVYYTVGKDEKALVMETIYRLDWYKNRRCDYLWTPSLDDTPPSDTVKWDL